MADNYHDTLMLYCHDTYTSGCPLCERSRSDSAFAAVLAKVPVPRRERGRAKPTKQATKQPRERKKIALPVCPFLGTPTGETRPCKTCTGEKQIPLRACEKLGVCTEEKLVTLSDGTPVQCCRICEHRPTAEPKRDTNTPYEPSDPAVVDRMLDAANVGPGDVVYDLGSGDGRILIAAAKRGARAVGIEIDPGRVKLARENALAAGVEVEVIEGDFHKVDLSPASVVMLYLWEAEAKRLIPSLERLKPGSRVVSHGSGIGDWPPDRVDGEGPHCVQLWTVRQLVTLDECGIGDSLCALQVATGAGAGFAATKSRRPWAELFASTANHGPRLDLFIDDAVYADRSRVSRLDVWARKVGCTPRIPPLLPLPADAERWAIPYAGRVVIAPFCEAANRQWPAAQWLEVNRLLVAAGHYTAIIDSGGHDRVKEFSESNEAQAGRTTILRGVSPQHVASALRWAAAFAGNDSGMAHLAGMIGTPGVAICSIVSDAGIFAAYPSILELGSIRRGEHHSRQPEQLGWEHVSPEDVRDAILAQVQSTSRGFPVAAFERVLLPLDVWRINAWIGVYRAIWELARELRPQRIVEIGCRAGYSSWTWLHALPSSTVQAYDANLAEHGGFVGSVDHARRILPADRWTLTVADSHTLTELPWAELVYIDGDHSEEGAYQDMRIALTSCPRWIVVDDVTNLADVRRAAERFASELGVVPRFVPSQTGMYVIEMPM